MVSEQPNDNRLQPFYTLSHWARLLLMALLAITFLGTTSEAVWQLVRPTTSLSGTAIEVAETRVNHGYAIYNLVLRTEQGDVQTIQLVNNGRILNYLLADKERLPSQVTVQQRQGRVVVLDLDGGSELTIRDSRVPPLVRLLIGLVPLLIFAFHIRPGLVRSQIDPTELEP